MISNNPDSTSTAVNWTLYDDGTGQIHPHEPLERYITGGFHPVVMGDALHDGRYIVRHKLGYGGFSTVWLASDEQDRESAHHYVSIKIESSTASELGIDADPEVLRLRKLEEHYLYKARKRSLEHMCSSWTPSVMKVPTGITTVSSQSYWVHQLVVCAHYMPCLGKPYAPKPSFALQGNYFTRWILYIRLAWHMGVS
jgi:hypothetical protein